MAISRDDLFLIDQIRNDSRQMVRELGFMQSTLAATDYSPSAVHAIIETGIRASLTAAQLAELLNLEKSSVSRLVRKLVQEGELAENVSNYDSRVKLLTLTKKGKETFARIEDYGRAQVHNAFSYLSQDECRIVKDGLSFYVRALESHRLGQSPDPQKAVRIEQGYRVGAVARVTEMHANFYYRHAGFGQFFESQVASGIAEFAGRLENPCNGLWLAVQGDKIVGSIAIDGEDMKDNKAHLRWFILDDGLRGGGVGRKLMTEAMAFCDEQRFAATYLWTFKGLHAARKLYDDFGFTLIEEKAGKQWGEEVTEQCFVRK